METQSHQAKLFHTICNLFGIDHSHRPPISITCNQFGTFVKEQSKAIRQDLDDFSFLVDQAETSTANMSDDFNSVLASDVT